MTSGGGGLPERQDPALDLSPEQFLKSLEPFERVLLEVREKLYEGSWERMAADLEARLKNEPYIYKLSQTINRDLSALRRLQTFEVQRGVDLSKLSG